MQRMTALLRTWLLIQIFRSSMADALKVLREDHAAELFRLAPGQNVPHHEIIYPSMVHPETGAHISYDVTSSSRSRRSTSAAGGATDLPVLSIKFSGLGEEFHVKLALNDRLLAPTFHVTTHHHDARNSTLGLDDHVFNCHHHGIAVSHENTLAAISTCDGVSGTVYDPHGGSFMIQPVPDHLHSADREHYRHASHSQAKPHVMYRREVSEVDPGQTVNESAPGCNVNAERQLQKVPVDIEGGDLQLVHQAVHRMRSEEILIGDPHPGKDRRKRETQQYHLEVMLVADNMLFSRRKFRTNTDATNYLLAIANLASLHFKADVLNVNIAFVVSKILLLNRTERGLNLGHNSEKTLSSFCMWQLRTQYTPYESDVNHYDLAILVTGWQLCAYSDNRGCDELGRAYVSGACFKYRMCSVVYDNGLTAGFVMAHETGHSLGLRHDGENGCPNRGALMSPTIAGRAGIYSWSTCSKTRLAQFIASPSAYCLRDEPIVVQSSVNDLAGRRFTLDEQCRLWMGRSSRFCPYSYARDDVCQKLWCRHTNSNCRTANVPAAAGSPCGYRRGLVCFRGQCTADTFVRATTQPAPTTPPPKIGVWDKWRPKGNCSRQCGGGIQVLTRYCVEKGTKEKMESSTCKGAWLKRVACNKQQCPELNSFLKNQCISVGQAKGFRDTTWFPGYLAATRCRLVCKSMHNASVDQVATDGTPCSYRYNDRCVNGKCVSIGCDFVEHSNARSDKCGICNGNGATCRKIEFSFVTTPSHSRNVTTLRLPKGARSIYIKEHYPQDTSHLLLTTMRDVPVLDGAWMYRRPHTTLRVFMAGTEFFYRQLPRRSESLSSAVAPINEDLLVKIVRKTNATQRLRFRYYLNPGEVRDSFVWEAATTPCSVTCGKGFYTQYPICRERATMNIVEALYCIPSKQHVNRTMSCSRSPCRWSTAPPTVTSAAPTIPPPSWKVSNWTSCSATCGGGAQRRRTVCRYNHRTVSESRCTSVTQARPAGRQRCATAPCDDARPVTDAMRPVTDDVRPVTDDVRPVTTDTDAHADKDDTRPVAVPVAPAVVHGDWSDFTRWTTCSLTCGGGVHYRSRTCTSPAPSAGGRNCSGHAQEQRMCNVQNCGLQQPELRVGLCAQKDNATGAKWVPSVAGFRSCFLICSRLGSRAAINFSTPLPDGSACNVVQNNRCVRGQCQAVGCDNVMGSRAEFDSCGVCKGSGRTCVSRSGRYSVAHALPGVYTIARFPRNSRMLTVVKANQHKRNHLFFKSASSGEILHPMSALSGSTAGITYVPFGNGYVQLRITKTKELFTIVGPLQEDILMLLNITSFSQRPSNPGFIWRYTVDRSQPQPRTNLAQRFERVMMVSGCSVTCGRGMVTMRERCLRKSDNRLASVEYCRTLPAVASTETMTSCFRSECSTVVPETYEWVSQPWKSCSKTCGRGLQSRDIVCKRRRDAATVSSNMCLSRARLPSRLRECNSNACPEPARWITGQWETCSVTCGGGRQLRSVSCEMHAPHQECAANRPSGQRGCGLAACPVPRQNSVCVDNLSPYYCSLVKSFNLCSANPRYAAACCSTCSK